MREECKHFQSRSYNTGEVVRFCELNLAPEAPWRCPDDCPSYARRMADVGWEHRGLVEPPIEDEPDVPIEDARVVLDEAEQFLAVAGPQIRDEVEREQSTR